MGVAPSGGLQEPHEEFLHRLAAVVLRRAAHAQRHRHAVPDGHVHEHPRQGRGVLITADRPGLLEAGQFILQELVQVAQVPPQGLGDLRVAGGLGHGLEDDAVGVPAALVGGGVGVEEDGEALGGVGDAFEGIAPGLDDLLADLLDQGDEQVQLVAEVAVEDRLGDARGFGELGRGGAPVAGLGEEFGRNFQELPAAVRGTHASHRGFSFPLGRRSWRAGASAHYNHFQMNKGRYGRAVVRPSRTPGPPGWRPRPPPETRSSHGWTRMNTDEHG